MNINDFINSLDRNLLVGKDWRVLLKEHGYYSIRVGEGDWQAVHEWCQKYIGEPHYTWTGEVFWFETERDAVTFSLRWS